MSVTDWGRLTSITRSKVMPAVVHQLKKEMPFFGRMLDKAKKKTVGGTYIEQPVTYKYKTAGGSYSGLEVLNTNLEDSRTRAKYDWKSVYEPIVIDNMELFKNGGSRGGEETVVNLLAQEMEEAKESMKNNLSTMVFGDGTGNGSKDLLGLKALVDDGTDVTSLGGITFGSYAWWQAQVSSAVGSLTLAHMASQYSNASSGRGVDSIDLIVTTETLWDAFESLLTPAVRYNDPAKGKRIEAVPGGGGGLYFRGAEVLADEYCTAGEMYFLNTRYLEMCVGDHPQHATDKNGFTVTPMTSPHDQDGQVGFILMYGQLINKRPSRMAKSQGLTA